MAPKSSGWSRSIERADGERLMKKHPKRVVVLATLCLLATAGSTLPQTAQQPAPMAPSHVEGSPAAPYALTMGDMMNTLIQPRHIKLGLAGRAENWPLAAYALAEIRQSFAGIAKAQPRFAGMPVPDLIDAAVGQPLRAVETAVKQRDREKFAVAYEQLTQGCNACHAAVDHPFVVIRVPDTSAFPNQDFSPKR
jgi:hypothetical protein